MLTTLSIKNFALIDDINVAFSEGFTIITGETGAGKSILLDGLSLVLGKRADLSSLRQRDAKCIIEAVFQIQQYGLQRFFDENDLDHDAETYLRREILPSGKSRAFINDSPVTLQVMQALGSRLIDIHSQYQTLELADNDFQFLVLDALANTKKDLGLYRQALSEFKSIDKRLEQLQQFKAEASKELDYNSFLLKELQEAQLEGQELTSLEEEHETLNNVEEIREQLTAAYQLLNDENLGILSNLQQLKNTLNRIAGFSEPLQEIADRIASASLELEDIFDEVQRTEERIEADPQRLADVNARLQTIHDLFNKHSVSTIPALVAVAHSLEEKVVATENVDEEIHALQKERDEIEGKLNRLARSIYENRQAAIPKLTSQLERMLVDLGMQNARFDIRIAHTDSFLMNGKDTISFMFSANKGANFGLLKKVASGGELSRIMLCIKAIISKYTKLPSIIFDEIDTGVSGAVSEKVADIMLQMSHSMQVFSITHLPQVAAKGHQHYKVYKTDDGAITASHLKQLSQEERVVEIAQMLGGSQITDSAVAHAKQLLN